MIDSTIIDKSDYGSIVNVRDSVLTMPVPAGSAWINTANGTSYTMSSAIGNNSHSRVVLSETGINIKAGADIVVGGKSLLAAIEAIEARLGILRVNPELESRWEQLKRLREQYIAMERDLLEKEKIMKILKES